MRDDNDIHVTTIRIPEYAVPQAFMRALEAEANPDVFVRVMGSPSMIDLGALIDSLMEHFEPCPVRLECAPTQTTYGAVGIEVWLTWAEAEKYIATHKTGALGELVRELHARASRFIESINTMRELE